MCLDLLQTTLLQFLSLDKNEPTSQTLSQFSTDQWQALLDLADGLNVTPLLHSKLKRKKLDAPSHIQQELHRNYLNNTGRNLAIFHAFRQLSAQLQAANISMIPLKGVYLADAIYPTLGERVIGDLDLLVPKDRIEEAIEIGIKCNFLPIKQVAVDAWLTHSHHVCPQHNADNGLTVEWHWHIERPQPKNQIAIQELWERAAPATISDQSVYALAIEDTIIHLAYHIAYHHQFLFGIRNLCDLSLICQTHAAHIDWDAVIQRARKWQYERGVYLSLLLIQTHLAAPIPTSVLANLNPKGIPHLPLELATQQVFISSLQRKNIFPTRSRIYGANGVRNKWRALQVSLFPQAENIAIWHDVDTSSMSTLARYLIRWRIMFRKAIYKIRGMSWGLTAVSSALKRKSQLSSWLNAID